MNILHIHTHTTSGGAAAFARSIHLRLLQYGFNSKYYAGYGIANELNNIEVLGISQWELFTNVIIYRLRSIEAPLNINKWFKVLPKLLNWCDVIHLHNVHGYYMPTEILEQILEKPVVWTLHDEWIMTGRCTFSGSCQGYLQGCQTCPFLTKYPSTLVDKARQDFLIRRTLIANTKATLISPSHVLRNKIIHSGFPGNKIKVIHNPTEFQEFYHLEERQRIKQELNLPEDKTVILFVANVTWSYRKGFDILEAALHKLHEPQNFILVVVGRYNRKVQQQVNNLPIKVKLLGAINNRADISRYYAASDVLVVPSREESFGLVTTEALSQGCQVICSDIPVFREVTDGEAIFFNLEDSQDLASKLNIFSQHKDTYQVSEQSVNNFRKRFSFKESLKAYIEAYHLAIERV